MLRSSRFVDDHALRYLLFFFAERKWKNSKTSLLYPYRQWLTSVARARRKSMPCEEGRKLAGIMFAGASLLLPGDGVVTSADFHHASVDGQQLTGHELRIVTCQK